jgi:hypothetical protein
MAQLIEGGEGFGGVKVAFTKANYDRCIDFCGAMARRHLGWKILCEKGKAGGHISPRLPRAQWLSSVWSSGRRKETAWPCAIAISFLQARLRQSPLGPSSRGGIASRETERHSWNANHAPILMSSTSPEAVHLIQTLGLGFGAFGTRMMKV